MRNVRGRKIAGDREICNSNQTGATTKILSFRSSCVRVENKIMKRIIE